ncbi:unnamed protein product, partial [Amoebophrya sp. A25]|eukprot:GSA25T00020451001.1
MQSIGGQENDTRFPRSSSSCSSSTSPFCSVGLILQNNNNAPTIGSSCSNTNTLLVPHPQGS